MNITMLDLGIILFGFSTMVWLGEVSERLSRRYPRFVFLIGLPVVIFTFATVEYALVRYANLFSPGFATFVFVLDNILGLTFLASLSLIISFYILFPWLKISREMLPQHIARRISLSKPLPTKGLGAFYVYVSFVVIGLMAIALFDYFRPIAFGISCNYPLDVFCIRMSVFIHVVSDSLNISNTFTQILIAIGAMAPSLGVAKTFLEVFKQVKDIRGDKQKDSTNDKVLVSLDE